MPKFLSEYQYALWQTYLLYINYVGILHFGLLDGIVLRYSKYDYDELDKPRIRSQFKCLLSITTVLCVCIILFVNIFLNSEMKIVFTMTAIGIVTRTVFNYTSYSFQITNRIKYYAKMIIGYRLFYGVGVVLLILLGFRDFYFFCFLDLGSDIFGILFSIHNNKGMYFGTSLKIKDTIYEAKKNISAGIMLMVSNFSSFLLTGSARFIIQWHWDEIMFGKVSFAISITNMFLTFVTAISVVLFPSLKRTEKKNLPDLYEKLRTIMNTLLIIILVLYYPGCWILKKWLPTYSDSLVYLGMLLPIIIFSSKISLLTNNYLKALRKEKKLLIINLISVGIAIITFWFNAYIMNNLKAVLVSIVFVVMLCSVLSEYMVMSTWKMFNIKKIIDEIIMTVIFVCSTMWTSQKVGLLIYSISLAVYLLIDWKNIRCVLKKV